MGGSCYAAGAGTVAELSDSGSGPHGDGQPAAIEQLTSEESMANAKHVDIRVKFMCDFAKKGIVKPEYAGSRLLMADLLTKAMPAPRIAEL